MIIDNHNIDIMFVIATDGESSKIINSVSWDSTLSIYGYNIYRMNRTPKVGLAVLGIAKVTFAIGVQMIIERFHPKMIFSLGFAGSLHQSITPIEVTIGAASFQYNVFSTRSNITDLDSTAYRRLKTIELQPDVINKVSMVLEAYNPHIVTIATSDNFLSDEVTKNNLMKSEKLMIVDQETAAFYQACYYSDVKCCAIKVITDYCDKNAYLHFDENQERAAEILLQIFTDLIQYPLS